MATGIQLAVAWISSGREPAIGSLVSMEPTKWSSSVNSISAFITSTKNVVQGRRKTMRAKMELFLSSPNLHPCLSRKNSGWTFS